MDTMSTTTYPSSYAGPVTALAADLQRDLGLLMKDLSSTYDGRPISSDELQLAINSQEQEQFIAIRDGRVIGAGSISLIPTSFSTGGTLETQPAAWLGSFIVHESYRGKPDGEKESIASQLWDVMASWSKDHGVRSLQFMTEADRVGAVHFYHKKGAVEVGVANLYNVPIDTSVALLQTNSTKIMGIVYETCKTQLILHLCDDQTTLSEANIAAHIAEARNLGISLMQYIAPAGSQAAHGLSLRGIEPRREEMVMRVEL
jgi:GNAT superfamily N-acetyltransferase